MIFSVVCEQSASDLFSFCILLSKEKWPQAVVHTKYGVYARIVQPFTSCSTIRIYPSSSILNKWIQVDMCDSRALFEFVQASDMQDCFSGQPVWKHEFLVVSEPVINFPMLNFKEIFSEEMEF